MLNYLMNMIETKTVQCMFIKICIYRERAIFIVYTRHIYFVYCQVDLFFYYMIGNFGKISLLVIGRDMLSAVVSQSELITNAVYSGLFDITKKSQVCMWNFCLLWQVFFLCIFLWPHNLYVPHFALMSANAAMWQTT